MVEVGTYLTNEKSLVQCITIDEFTQAGEKIPIYICEDVSEPTDRPASIIKLSKGEIERREWREVELSGKA